MLEHSLRLNRDNRQQFVDSWVESGELQLVTSIETYRKLWMLKNSVKIDKMSKVSV